MTIAKNKYRYEKDKKIFYVSTDRLCWLLWCDVFYYCPQREKFGQG
jgi:hypothetical protein